MTKRFIIKRCKTITCFLAIVFGHFIFTPKLAFSGQGDYVVILHGIARSSSSMNPLAKFLKEQGYEISNLDYPSTRFNLDKLVEHIHGQVKSLYKDPTRKLNFVTHSMGGILVRILLNRHPPQNLGRVVMLAPPNGGSEAADFWKDNWLYRKIFGPSGQQLTTDQTGLEKLLGRVNFQLGVIAGDRSIDPVNSLIIEGPDDGKVSVQKTKVVGMKDHVVVHATHTFIMDNRDALEQVDNFLKNGKFKKEK